MDVVAEANASELPRILHKSSRRSSWILVLLVFFGLCAAAAYVWTNMETILASRKCLGPRRCMACHLRLGKLCWRFDLVRHPLQIGLLRTDIAIEFCDYIARPLLLGSQSLLRLQPNQLRSWRKERSSPLSQKGQFPLAARR